jgi:tetratricopeptide (TPR) repeat protein
MKQAMLALCLLSGGLAWPAGAEPYLPASDDTVLETLPARGEPGRALRQMQARVRQNPADAAPALELARRHIELGRAASDPRHYGHAESVLAPWLRGGNPSPEALVLRATLHQSRHEFDRALADLSAALSRQPRLAQAWLTRAVILEVRGDYAAALQSCQALARLASGLLAATCLQSSLSLSGQAEFAYPRLRQDLEDAQGDETERQWAWVTLAEMAERLGRYADADGHYRQAFALGQRTAYLLASYADFLLDRDRPAEVVERLRDETRADNLLLRLTLAERRLNLPGHAAHVETLKARFAASRLRGDTSHQGDEARFTLHLLGDAVRALALAQANWAVQREPRDLRILLEAARAAGSPEAARAGLDFLARTRLQDARLRDLIEFFREKA